MASTIGAYLREGARNYQANMSVDGDPTTGIDAWKRLDPPTRNALLVQFYKQGPTPKLALKSAMIAAQNGVPYVPRVGVDGAGATYLANEPAIIQALADGPASFSDRWNATNDRAGLSGYRPSVRDSVGRIADPAAHADAQTPVDLNLGPPAYIPEYQRYLQDADGVPRTRPEDVRVLGECLSENRIDPPSTRAMVCRCPLFHPTRRFRSRRKATSRDDSDRGLRLPAASLPVPIKLRRDSRTRQTTKTGPRCGAGGPACPRAR